MTTYTAHTGRSIRTRYAWGVVHTVVLRYRDTGDWSVILAGLGVSEAAARAWLRELGLLRSKSEARALHHRERRRLDYAAMRAEVCRLRAERGLRTGVIAQLVGEAYGYELHVRVAGRWLREAGLGYAPGSPQERRCRREAGRLGAERRWGEIANPFARYHRSQRRRGLYRRQRAEEARRAFVWTKALRAEALDAALDAAQAYARRTGVDAGVLASECWLYLERHAHTYRPDGRSSWRAFCFHIAMYGAKDWMQRENERRRRERSGFVTEDGANLTLDRHFDADDTLSIYEQAERRNPSPTNAAA